MKLTVTRTTRTSKSTIGRLAIDGTDFCWTLEDVVRTGPKVWGQTAIPAGTYKVLLTESPRFKRILPLLVNVPEFDGVRIHPGNKPEDTDGCILVGLGRADDYITDSRAAFDALFAKLHAAAVRGEAITIEIA
jgi:hypothetical protein